MQSFPCRRALYCKNTFVWPHVDARMLRLSPAFCRTFLPGSSTVPLALAVMFLTLSVSNTNSLCCGLFAKV